MLKNELMKRGKQIDLLFDDVQSVLITVITLNNLISFFIYFKINGIVLYNIHKTNT